MCQRRGVVDHGPHHKTFKQSFRYSELKNTENLVYKEYHLELDEIFYGKPMRRVEDRFDVLTVACDVEETC